MTAARVVVVCTGNQCRSAMAELLFRRALAQSETGPAWEVSSAGTRAAEGQPIHRVAGDVLRARGVVVDGFRSRPLTPAIVADSDLILTAERSHRAAVVSMVPDALHRTFTLLQFARLIQAGDIDRAGHPQHRRRRRCSSSIARRARSRSEPGDDDLLDPAGRRRRHVEAVAARIETALTDHPRGVRCSHRRVRAGACRPRHRRGGSERSRAVPGLSADPATGMAPDRRVGRWCACCSVG